MYISARMLIESVELTAYDDVPAKGASTGGSICPWHQALVQHREVRPLQLYACFHCFLAPPGVCTALHRRNKQCFIYEL